MRFESTGSRAGSRRARFPKWPSREGGAGFTLIETLTALTILAMALVSLFEAQAGGGRMADAASNHTSARILASSLLGETVGGEVASLGSRQGRFDRFAWSIEVAPAQGPWADLTTDEGWRLRHVRVTVSWDLNRSIHLETLRLGRNARD